MKTVFTNGVFDILHPGHLMLLEKAKKLGDYLIVAIDSDRHTREIKRGRPINNQEFRKKILEAIRWVDKVVIFDDLETMIAKIVPDILVKGGDYKKSKVVGRSIVEYYGGKVVIIPILEGYSTTNIINKVIDKHENAK